MTEEFNRSPLRRSLQTLAVSFFAVSGAVVDALSMNKIPYAVTEDEDDAWTRFADIEANARIRNEMAAFLYGKGKGAVSPAVTAVPACKANAVDPSATPGWSMALVSLALPIPDVVLRQEKLGKKKEAAGRQDAQPAAESAAPGGGNERVGVKVMASPEVREAASNE